ncbi:MAG: class I SAM-dependent methyltransferase [Desulfovibrionaceae bacterium]|jgi:SAM-dependent methyltransferase|nr:class I SAM-dependent methyltransferase [Desulfovibrionaceae bacterium]
MNPHFDQNRILWKDEYSGQYEAPVYSEQFELQWNLALKNSEYSQTPGSSTSDAYINDRIYEWTGVHPDGIDHFHDPTMGSRKLHNPIDPALIRNKRCLDLCCGHGRWTKVMQRLGAQELLSTDISASALQATSKFNENVREVDVMRIPQATPDLVGRFDFTNFWGVAMCTHDPKLAFENAASTVAPGGSLYLMVYAPCGIHGTELTNIQRRIFHSLENVEDRLAFVGKVWERKWDGRYPLKSNILNALYNLRGLDRGYKIGVLDMLAPYYNWVIALETIVDWMNKAGFAKVVHLNDDDPEPCAFHVLGCEKR